MKTYQSLIKIWTFQNNIGLNLYIIYSMSYRIAISEEDLERN